MPKLLTRNGRVLRLDSGAIAAKVDGETCHCCNSDSCSVCTDLICPTQSGLTVTLSGIQLASELFTPTGDPLGTVTWSTGTTLAGSFCLRNNGCNYSFVSKVPVVIASVTAPGESDNPDYVPVAVDFYLFLVFNCSTNVVDAIIQNIVSTGESAPITLFATTFDSGVGTGASETAWPRTCGTGGYTLSNTLGAFGDSANGDDYAGGKNGTIETITPCDNVSCSDGCVDSSLFLSVSGGGLTVGTVLTRTAPGTGCGYAFDDGHRHGTLVPRTMFYGAAPLTTFRLTIRDRDADGDPLIRDTSVVCTGDVGSIKRTYPTTVSGETITVS